ncbi:MAG: hypothetical protein ACTSW1_06555 [Candidatus Hodarchaeales archaeon]
MTIDTSDSRSNSNEQIIFAAQRIGGSEKRRKVFKEIHRGKKKRKTVSEIVEKTGLNRIQVLQAGNYLANNKIISKDKTGELAYIRDDFYFQNKKKILRLAGNKDAQKKYPTKRNIVVNVTPQDYVKFPKIGVDVERITIDDIDSFRKVIEVPLSSRKNQPLDEEEFQQGLQRILEEEGVFKDWGGEMDDLYTNRVIIKGRRLYTAFGLKGKGKKGKLTPKGMGKQGDQIQRLFRAPADVYIVQYWDQIDESIIEQMEAFATAKSALEGKKVLYGIIDGQDTNRLIQAYPDKFELTESV